MATNICEESAQGAWDTIPGKVKEPEASGMKRAEISRLPRHTGRSAVTNWLDVLELDFQDYLPGSRKESGKSEGESAVIRRVAPHAPDEVVQGDSLPQIPVMGGTGAGDDVELFQAAPSCWIAVLPQYTVHKDVFGLVVYGDSMEPTMCNARPLAEPPERQGGPEQSGCGCKRGPTASQNEALKGDWFKKVSRVETLRADRTGRKCEPYRAGQHDDAEKAGTTPEHAKA